MKPLLAALLLAATPAIWAQRPADRPDPVIWDGGNLHVVGWGRVEVEKPGRQRGETLRFASGPAAYDFTEGVHWYAEAKRSSTPTMADGRVTALFKYEGQAWVRYAEFEYPAGAVRHLHPLGNGRVWALSPRPGAFKNSEGASFPLAILSRNPQTEKLNVHEVLDFGLEKPYFYRRANPVDSHDSPYHALAFDMMEPLVMRAGSYLVMCLPDPGFFWVFDGTTGRLKRRAQLYSFIGEELLSTRFRDLAPCILAAHPRSDGKILISARSEDAVNQAARAYREHMPTIATDQDYTRNLSKIRELQDLNLKMFPRVVWWVFDPETGSIQEEMPPLNFPTLVQTTADLQAYRWRFKPDGNLLFLGRYTDGDGTPERPESSAAPKAAPRKKGS